MFKALTEKIFGNRNERELRKLRPIVDEINSIFSNLENKTDDELRARIQEIKIDIRGKVVSLEKELKDTQYKYQVEPDENKRNSIGNEIDRIEKRLNL